MPLHSMSDTGAPGKRILVPIDGSTAAERGLDAALALAGALQAELRLLHVLDPRLLLPQNSGAKSADELLAEQRAEGERLLADALAKARGQSVAAHARLRRDPPQRVSDLIVEEARAWPADLIAMGTHGRRGWRRVALGSAAEAVLRASPAPVLMVRGDDATE